jgi:hemerythrin-like domain-containing protein
MADRTLSQAKQVEIYEQIEKIEEEVVGHGVHEQYHELLKQFKTKYL